VTGVLLGEAPGTAPGSSQSGPPVSPLPPLWRVQLSVEYAAATDEPVVVHADALRRVVPRRGERARVVLGESRALEGEVLSVEGGVAVLKIAPSAAEELGQVGGGDPRRVRVLPLDALCRVE